MVKLVRIQAPVVVACYWFWSGLVVRGWYQPPARQDKLPSARQALSGASARRWIPPAKHGYRLRAAVANDKDFDDNDEEDEAYDKNNDNDSFPASALRAVTYSCLDATFEPELLGEFLMELGGCSATLMDHDRDSPQETPIYREPDQQDEDWPNDIDAALVTSNPAVGRNVWKRCDLVVHFPASVDVAQVTREARDTLGLPSLVFEEDVVDTDCDWMAQVQQTWPPLAVPPFLLTFPWHSTEDIETVKKWESSSLTRDDWMEIQLEGGIAFGTGEHATTQLCLEWIARQDSEDWNYFLDYGCGSAILGLAAAAKSPLKLKSIGVDIDIDAVRIGNVNAETNDLPMTCYLAPPMAVSNDDHDNNDEAVASGDGNADKDTDDESTSLWLKSIQRATQHSTKTRNEELLPSEFVDREGVFDAAVANILAAPLIRLAPTLAHFLKDDAPLGLSGVLSHQAPRVVKAYQDYFNDVQVAQEGSDGWVLITGQRKRRKT